ncbi:MAG: Do family serine endopeptidase [Bacteroidota bacterium]
MKKNIIAVFVLLVIGALFGIILVSGFGYVRPSLADVQIGSEKPPVQQINADAQAFNDAFVNVAEKVTPSIVQITVVSKMKTDPHKGLEFFLPFRGEIPKERQGGGSGVIISSDGYILTNNHVVENATQVEVALKDKRKFSAVIIGTDPLTDLSVIKIDAKDLKAVHLGDSDNLKVGQWVMAIGNPLSLSSTVTAGIVSAIGRNINIIKDSYGVENFIQTDAAINPGNSGGALVNLNGSVVGINTAIATDGITSSYIGYGFAIPINLARAVSEDLIEHGIVSRGYIGVRIEEVDADLAKAVGLDKPKGVLIQEVVDGGSASAEDIVAGDIILKIDNKDVDQPNELQSYVASKRAGSKITLTIFRDGKTIERKVKLKAREDEESKPVVAKKEKQKSDDSEVVEVELESLGLTIKNADSKTLKEYKTDYGVLITNVKKFSKAENQRLFPGLIISEVDRRKVNDASDFEDKIKNSKGSAVLLKVLDKNGTSRFVGLEIPQ